MQDECEKQGCIAIMVGLLASKNAEMVGMAAKGLVNFAYASTPAQKKRVMEAMPGAAPVKAIIEGSYDDEVKVLPCPFAITLI